MKYLYTLIALMAISFTGNAQVTSLNETFDVTCAVSGLNYPTGWSEYHIPTTDNLIAWNCSTVYGVGGTGCQQINGYYSATNHIDSAWLITPALDLSGYTGSIYMQFSDIFRFNGDRVAVLVSQNYQAGYPDSSIYTWTNLTSSLAPNFTTADSLNWTTHRVDLSAYKSAPLRFAFRYTSSNTACARWNIDNVKTVYPTAISTEENQPTEMQVTTTANSVTLTLNSNITGPCDLQVYDILGKNYYNGTIQLQNGTQKFLVDGLHLQTGMYLIRLSNSDFNKVIRTIVSTEMVNTN